MDLENDFVKLNKITNKKPLKKRVWKKIGIWAVALTTMLGVEQANAMNTNNQGEDKQKISQQQEVNNKEKVLGLVEQSNEVIQTLIGRGNYEKAEKVAQNLKKYGLEAKEYGLRDGSSIVKIAEDLENKIKTAREVMNIKPKDIKKLDRRTINTYVSILSNMAVYAQDKETRKSVVKKMVEFNVYSQYHDLNKNTHGTSMINIPPVELKIQIEKGVAYSGGHVSGENISLEIPLEVN